MHIFYYASSPRSNFRYCYCYPRKNIKIYIFGEVEEKTRSSETIQAQKATLLHTFSLLSVQLSSLFVFFDFFICFTLPYRCVPLVRVSHFFYCFYPHTHTVCNCICIHVKKIVQGKRSDKIVRVLWYLFWLPSSPVQWGKDSVESWGWRWWFRENSPTSNSLHNYLCYCQETVCVWIFRKKTATAPEERKKSSSQLTEYLFSSVLLNWGEQSSHLSCSENKKYVYNRPLIRKSQPFYSFQKKLSQSKRMRKECVEKNENGFLQIILSPTDCSGLYFTFSPLNRW